MSSNKAKTLRNEYSWSTKILDADSKPACLDNVIKTCENLLVEEQHQLKILLQKYENLNDGSLEEFNLELGPLILHLMYPNCKLIHVRAYTVLRSVKQQLKLSKEIVRLVDIGVLEGQYFSELDSTSPAFVIP
jgi:hypothetical protein